MKEDILCELYVNAYSDWLITVKLKF